MRRSRLATAITGLAVLLLFTTGIAGDAEAKKIKGKDIARGAISAKHIKAGALTGAKIADGSITAADLDAGLLGPAVIPEGAVGTDEVADDSLTAADLAPNSVGASEIGASAVGTSEVADGSLTGADIQDGSLTEADLADAPGADSVTNNGTIVITATSFDAPELVLQQTITAPAAGVVIANVSSYAITTGLTLVACSLGTGAAVDFDRSVWVGDRANLITELFDGLASTHAIDVTAGSVTVKFNCYRADTGSGSHSAKVIRPEMTLLYVPNRY